MSLLGRLAGRIGSMIDDVTLTERQRRLIADAAALIESNSAVAAERALDELERERPGLGRAYLLRGLARELLGDPAGARAWLERALAASDDPATRLALGRVCAALGAWPEAARHLEEVAARGELDERVAALQQLADGAVAAADRALQRRSLRRLVALVPADHDSRWSLAHALRDDGALDEAIEVVEPILEGPGAPVLWVRQSAQWRVERGTPADLDRAEQVLRMLWEVHRDPVDARAVADLLLERGGAAQAVGLLHEAVALAQPHELPALLLQIAETHRQLGNNEVALDAVVQGLRAAPESLPLRLLEVALALDLGLLEQAHRSSLALHPHVESSRHARALRGRALLAVGRVAEATAVLTPLRAARMSVADLNALGALALAQRDPSEALALFHEAHLADPGDAVAVVGLESARVALVPALLLPPTDAGADAMVALCGALGPVFAAAGMPASVSRLSEIARSTERPLSVAVMGEFNAGKSTLLNAWVGEAMLAVGVLPTTAHINVVKWGPRKVARYVDRDGREHEATFAEAAQIVKRRAGEILGVEYWFPNPELRAVNFWDTPGFNAPDPLHEARAIEALQSADAVIWLLDVRQALSATQLERLEQIRSPRERVLVVVNKVDELQGDLAARQQVLAHVQAGLGERVLGIFAVSARDALAARQHDAPEAQGDGGWAALMSAVQTHFFDRAGRLKAIEAGRSIADLVSAALERVQAELDGLETARAEIRDAKAALANALEGAAAASLSGRARSEWSRQLNEVRERALWELRSAAPSADLLGRRVAPEAVCVRIGSEVAEQVGRGAASVALIVQGAAASAADAVVAAGERAATLAGAATGSAMRRRIDAYLVRRELLDSRLVQTLVTTEERVVRARVEAAGTALLNGALSESARTGDAPSLLRLVPNPSDEWVANVEMWVAEYGASASALLARLDREVDLLAIDRQQRIIRPLQALLGALEAAV